MDLRALPTGAGAHDVLSFPVLRPGALDLRAGLAALRAAVAMAAQDLAGSLGSALAPPVEGMVAPRVAGDTLAPPPGKVPEPRDLSDVAALVARAQSGDAEAFGDLYDRYVVTVYRYIYYRVGSGPLAEDLTSETFLRALRRIDSFTWQGKDVAAWLVTIARNLIVDHYKSSRYRLEVSTADLLGSAADRPDAEAGPEAAALASISNEALIEAVRTLGAEQQECLVLRFLQGLSLAETALAMGKKEGAIKALQYRAVRSLARALPEGFTG